MADTQEKATKKEFKSYTDLQAWRRGQEVAQATQVWAQEYAGDAQLREWCHDIQVTLRDSWVQLMEAFSKYHSADKLRRYEACYFYINRNIATLKFGQLNGWWQAAELVTQYEEYAGVVRATMSHFWGKKSEKAPSQG